MDAKSKKLFLAALAVKITAQNEQEDRKPSPCGLGGKKI